MRAEIDKQKSRLQQVEKQMAAKRKDRAGEHKKVVKLQDDIKHKVWSKT